MKGTLWYTGFNEAQLQDIALRFGKLLGEDVEFEYIENKSIIGGFVAHIGGKAYDVSVKNRLSSVRASLKGDRSGSESLLDLSTALSRGIESYDFNNSIYDYGTIISSGDGIIQVEGLSGRKYGELLEMSGGAVAMALEVTQELVGAAVLSGDMTVGGQVHGTGHVLDVPVGSAVLGRVLSPTGRALDGEEEPRCATRRPIESPAPHIMDRKAVFRPMQTGLLSIDSMIPIGRGQRELIIGDRQTGKTTIAVDTILNQKDQDVICVYCAIGQKASTVAELVETLTRGGAMPYTTIISSPASDPPAMQYIAPYAACAIAEGFMYAGRDVLIIYDDLSKHAVSYRAMSLLLHRPPGREAYPGDVFYLHSRLLERSAQLSDDEGGGSLTALPIVETMAGDISAYIPTNIISITDGQIFLESELFHSGMRPAVNVGLSVSRVGRNAQYPAMRKVTGTLRLDLAQYREMSVFLQFGAEVDASTKAMLDSGVRKNELLKQPKHEPYALSDEVCILMASDAGIFSDVPVDHVDTFLAYMLAELRKYRPEKLAVIEQKHDFDADTKDALLTCMRRSAAKYKMKLTQWD